MKVQIIRINPETQRISLGMKQLDKDPWEGVAAKYPIGAKVKGRVTNITDYGAFVELEDGIEGLVHVSEMSWTKKNVHPGKILSTSEEITVQVLEVDPSKRRISLGLKQTQNNPWESFAEKYPTGTDRRRRDQEHHRIRPVRRSRRRCRRHGPSLRPRLEDVRAKRRSRTTRRATTSRPRCSTSISRRSASRSASSRWRAIPMEQLAGIKKGDTVTCEVVGVEENGLEVKIAGSDMTAFIKRADLARDRSEQRPERFAVGEKVDAKVTQIDRQEPQGHGLDQGAGNRRREGCGGAVWLVRLGRLAGRHSRRRAEQGQEGRRGQEQPTE